MIYDYIIIGGGISGFYCGLEVLKHNKNVVLCEKYKTLGGRISTFHKGKYSWEAGAGRISINHNMVLDLLKHYKHEVVPISGSSLYINTKDKCIEPDLFEGSIDAYMNTLEKLDPKVLANHTIKELMIQIHGKEKAEDYLDRFPYRAEAEVLRADLAINVFRKEMGPREEYFVCKDGLSSLITSMKNDFLKKGGTLLYEYTCVNISKDLNVEFLNNSKSKVLQAKKIICAMESEALKKIPFFKDFQTLRHLRMEPLLRTYAIYDTPWFSQLPKIITNSPIRYFIPVDYKNNVSMISYTDSRDTKGFHTILRKYGESSLGKHIQNLLKKIFGVVPDYIFFKSHYWKYGATYWLPGDYDPVQESKKSLKPFEEEVYVVGESFSLKQAWIEGSLEQCKKLFDTYS